MLYFITIERLEYERVNSLKKRSTKSWSEMKLQKNERVIFAAILISLGMIFLWQDNSTADSLSQRQKGSSNSLAGSLGTTVNTGASQNTLYSVPKNTLSTNSLAGSLGTTVNTGASQNTLYSVPKNTLSTNSLVGSLGTTVNTGSRSERQ
jgi:hypothetical protein